MSPSTHSASDNADDFGKPGKMEMVYSASRNPKGIHDRQGNVDKTEGDFKCGDKNLEKLILGGSLQNSEQQHQREAKVFFYVTGFGRFGNILENPTMHLVNNLPGKLAGLKSSQFKLAHSEIIPVTMTDCDTATSRIYQLVKDNLGKADHHVVLNFGVAAGRPCFNLESTGKNIANFGIPDMGGNQPRNAQIDKNEDLTHSKRSGFLLPMMSQKLKAKGHECSVSMDAGDYICNYAYYRNLMAREKFCEVENCVKV